MLDENAEAVAERFKAKLTNKEFTMARSANSEQNYTESKQAADTQAVENFVETEFFQDIARWN